MRCYALGASHASHSGIRRPTYVNLIHSLDTGLSKFSPLVQKIEYGESIEKKTLYLYIIGKKNVRTPIPRPALLMTGNTHGDEYLNIEDRLPSFLLAKSSTFQNFIKQNGVLLVVPVVNPDGFETGERANAHGVDLNRNWNSQNLLAMEPESEALRIQIEKLTQPPWNLKIQVSVDYHCCTGAVLYPWSYTENPLPEQALQKHLLLASLAEKLLKVPFGTTSQILGYRPKGTTKDYFFEKYQTTAFTFEGREKEENQYLPEHIAWWEKIVEYTIPNQIRRSQTVQRKKTLPKHHIAD